MRLAKSDIAVKIEGENWALQAHRGNAGATEALQYLGQQHRMRQSLPLTGFAALSKFLPCVLRNLQVGNTLEGGPTESGSAVPVYQTNVFHPVQVGPGSFQDGFLLLFPPGFRG
jgi:hypothetical protein